MMLIERTDIAIAVGILATIFMACLVVLIFICWQRTMKQVKSHEMLVPPQLELGDLRLHPEIEQILSDQNWVDDATGLVPHCLAVLKLCHQLTERLAAIAMQPMHKRQLEKVAEIARQTSFRVDDVVRSMYPPLDARLLEARTNVLVLTVSHLAITTRNACCRKPHRKLAFEIEAYLENMNPHLQVLREAATAQETAGLHLPSGCRTSSSNS